MEQLAGFDFVRLPFDGDGKLQSQTALDELIQAVKSGPKTDVIFVAHGFRNDANEATNGIYGPLLANFRKHMDPARRYVVAGVYWPSKAFPEGPSEEVGNVQSAGGGDEELDAALLNSAREQLEAMKEGSTEAQRKSLTEAQAALEKIDEDDAATQRRFVDLVLSAMDDTYLGADEGLAEIRTKDGDEVLNALRTPIILRAPDTEDDEGSVNAVSAGFGGAGAGTALSVGSFFGKALGRVGTFLNMTTWYQMKNRSGAVGTVGLSRCVRAVKTAVPDSRVHLVGHSLGGRLMAACSKALSDPPKVQADSLTLLQAAFSHYGFASDNGHGSPGFFRSVLGASVVKGPLTATYSHEDQVVGKAYALASRLAGDNVKAIGDADDPYGGIGRNGTQRTAEATLEKLHSVGQPYAFASGKVHCMDGSGGLITSHGDITNERVAWLVASAIRATA